MSVARGEALLAELSAVLDEELEAIRALDATRISAIVARKETIVARLGGVDLDGDRATKRAAVGVLARAQANRLLLEDVTQSLRRRLGLTETGGTYDRRARRVTTQRGPGRAI